MVMMMLEASHSVSHSVSLSSAPTLPMAINLLAIDYCIAIPLTLSVPHSSPSDYCARNTLEKDEYTATRLSQDICIQLSLPILIVIILFTLISSALQWPQITGHPIQKTMMADDDGDGNDDDDWHDA